MGRPPPLPDQNARPPRRDRVGTARRARHTGAHTSLRACAAASVPVQKVRRADHRLNALESAPPLASCDPRPFPACWRRRRRDRRGTRSAGPRTRAPCADGGIADSETRVARPRTNRAWRRARSTARVRRAGCVSSERRTQHTPRHDFLYTGGTHRWPIAALLGRRRHPVMRSVASVNSGACASSSSRRRRGR